MSISETNEIGKPASSVNRIFVILSIILLITLIAGLFLINKQKQTLKPTQLKTISLPAAVLYSQNATTSNSTSNGGKEMATTTKIKVKKYVASKTGKTYYLTICSAASRIVEKNRVWFDTPQEAETFGYVAAKNCKEMN
jgi:hypothetical protein